MEDIRYIHAADLHLDTPFAGIGRELAEGNSRLLEILREAPFDALNRLVRLCLETRPNFLILAGDIYNTEDRSIRARLALKKACEQLAAEGIAVYIVHGNHDPLSSQMVAIKYPGNTKIFGPQVETVPYMRQGETLALIHGISHETDREARNLANLFSRAENNDCFQLGVLHCSVQGRQNSDRYAPCSLDDLIRTGLDAWALGHIHERSILNEVPFIAYSGNTQGLQINETGLRGCYDVRASNIAGQWRCTAEFRSLCVIEWKILQIDLDGIESLDEVVTRIDSELASLKESADPSLTGMIVRILLQGRTTLNRYLRTNGTSAIANELQYHASGQPSLWVKDILICTRDLMSEEDTLQREDLLGECARYAKNLRDNEEELQKFAAEALKSLKGKSKYANSLPDFDLATLKELLDSAERLCRENLEER